MCLRIHFKIYAQSLSYNTVFFFFSFLRKFFLKKIYDKKKTDFLIIFYIFHESDIKNFLNDQMFKIFSNNLLTNITRVQLTYFFC